MPGFCEEQQVYAHARDPYKRVDILPSSRHVRILLGGVTIADTNRVYGVNYTWILYTPLFSIILLFIPALTLSSAG